VIASDINIHHLLKLLDDENPEIQRILKKAILENSLEFIFRRQHYQEQVDEERRKILQWHFKELHFELVREAFRRIVRENLEDIHLEKAVLVLSYWNDPTVNIPALTRQLDRMANEIGSLMPLSGHPLGFIDHMNHYLFEKCGFRGNTLDYYNPDNSFIDRVLDSRKGIPITLSVLYMLIARRLRMPIIGVPMPAHFIVKFDNGSDEIFFDPFYGGKVYSRQECLGYLNNANVTDPLAILSGCNDHQIVERMMRNIHLVYSSYRDEPEKIAQIEKLLNLLEKNYS